MACNTVATQTKAPVLIQQQKQTESMQTAEKQTGGERKQQALPGTPAETVTITEFCPFFFDNFSGLQKKCKNERKDGFKVISCNFGPKYQPNVSNV